MPPLLSFQSYLPPFRFFLAVPPVPLYLSVSLSRFVLSYRFGKSGYSNSSLLEIASSFALLGPGLKLERLSISISLNFLSRLRESSCTERDASICFYSTFDFARFPNLRNFTLKLDSYFHLDSTGTAQLDFSDYYVSICDCSQATHNSP